MADDNDIDTKLTNENCIEFQNHKFYMVTLIRRMKLQVNFHFMILANMNSDASLLECMSILLFSHLNRFRFWLLYRVQF